MSEKQDTQQTKNDSWHATKNMKKGIAQCVNRAAISKRETWSPLLQDKVETTLTHAFWCMKNCNGNPEILKRNLLNIIEHYKGNHAGCYAESRCRKDKNDEPSRQILSDAVAIKLLFKVLTSYVLYKSPHDFVLARDTFYVESFNNVMNIFHDKRISFSDKQYETRSVIAVCHWNTNVDRKYTSLDRKNIPNA
ncbi:hypothetical protein KP79_PYT17520 [Mizuhopecten yessoensis]|uniref:Uncharacterized protein n=1 Tax=Mizuhopecten yessoensis TaxID=6573 RepID=A0A210QL74_MIZYE|nr:hypothetical protein KP79_PYT17520 [Mizuhopecten yessoensis]